MVRLPTNNGLETMDELDELKTHLPEYADANLEPTNKRGFYICPFCSSGAKRKHTAAFHLFKAKDGADMYKCSSCGETGTLFHLIQKIENLSYSDAIKRARELYGIPGNNANYISRQDAPRMRYERPVQLNPDEPPSEWQSMLLPIIERAKEYIFEPGGRDALEYLHYRGIDDESIRAHDIGFIPMATAKEWMLEKGYSFVRPSWIPGERGFAIPAGISMPYMMDGKLYKLEMRRTPGQLKIMREHAKPDENGNKPEPDKVMPVRGSLHSIFNADDAECNDKRRDIIFTEGVIDALSINQAVGRWCNDEIKAVTYGAAGTKGDLNAFYKWYVLPYRVIVSLDNDKTGREQAEKLAADITRARHDAGRNAAMIAYPPAIYKDWNEFLMNDSRSMFEYVASMLPLDE